MCSDNDYSFGVPFVTKMKAVGLSDSDIEKIKIWSSDYPKEYPVCG
jgi:alpha-amylase